jgi:acyl-CoA synthetase (AMP-forming)/AMP-acid ligase II
MPKGAMLSHFGIVNRIQWMQDKYPLTYMDKVLQKTPYIFDVSVWELLWANWYGATIVIAKPEGHKDNQYLCKLVSQQQITTLHFVPAMLDAYLDSISNNEIFDLQAVKQIFCSGEALTKYQVDKFEQAKQNKYLRSETKLYNLYGPTEASIDVTYYDCDKQPDLIPVGKPISNTKIYILTPNLTPVPTGVTGELYIAGAGLARGYLNQPELTQERFIPNPFATAADIAKGYTRLYKTGTVKGGTTYRAGTMTTVLSSADKKEYSENVLPKTQSPKRPTTLECDIHQLQVLGEKWVVIVGLFGDGRDPYEVFAFKKKEISISANLKEGTLTKIKSGRYDLDINGVIIEDVKKHFETREEEALTRMISTSLRHGADINFIYDQLQKSPS